MITFNGIPLSVCTAEMADRIGGLINWREVLEPSLRQWASLSYNTESMFPGEFGNRPIIPGELWWPSTAAEWACGHFIVQPTEAAKLVDLVGTLGTLRMTWEEQSAENDGSLSYDSNGYPITDIVDQINASMTLLSLRPLNIGADGECFLATFVDQRFFWWAANTGGIQAVPGVTAWTDLYTLLGAQLGVTINYDSPAAAYLAAGPAAIVDLNYEPVPQWLDTVALNIGQKVFTTLAGDVFAYSPLPANIKVPPLPPTVDAVAGGVYEGSTEILQPESMDVAFPVFVNGNWNGTFYVINVPLGGTGGKATFKPGIVALGTGVPSNLSVLTAYADQLAADLFLWTGQAVDVVLPGIQDVTLNPLHGNVLWTYQRDRLTTRVQFAPWDWKEWPLCCGSMTMPTATSMTGTSCTDVCVEGEPTYYHTTGQACIDSCARGLLGPPGSGSTTPVQVVSSLPGSGYNGQLVYDYTNQTLYVWDQTTTTWYPYPNANKVPESLTGHPTGTASPATGGTPVSGFPLIATNCLGVTISIINLSSSIALSYSMDVTFSDGTTITNLINGFVADTGGINGNIFVFPTAAVTSLTDPHGIAVKVNLFLSTASSSAAYQVYYGGPAN